ncbi:ROK family protein [Luteimicrobium xylanilyticum]|uniref:Glucokinase n=1 Tax=Luteimicrobium xylanilyticum TaxID=1133546 RepID=A0A5P9Q7T9_9MICO|nr:ROK family protein [Luteimicrobium xylanilyticum]QFU97491.1 Glucokinase [Luteimicrobium xylanilyticum]
MSHVSADAPADDAAPRSHAHRATEPVVLALDVGGTSVKGAVVDAAGIAARRTAPTGGGPADPDGATAAVLGVVRELWAAVPAEQHVAAVGIVTPGLVDEEAGVVVGAENLGWRDLPLRALVEETTGVPVGFGHDARAAGLAEWRLGAGQGAGDHAFLSVGTGIAAALVLGGRVYAGGGWAGEIGHGGATAGDLCACGGRGCVETYASAAGIARQYAARTGTVPDGARDVLERAQAGDAVALEVWQHGVDGLADLVSGLVRTLGLRTVVVGGGLVLAGDALLEPLDRAVRARLTVHPAPELRTARLGAEAGTYGAALLAWQASGRSVSSDLGLAV